MSGRSMHKYLGVLAAVLLCGCSSDWSAGLADQRAGAKPSDPHAALMAPAPHVRAAGSFASAPDLGSLVRYPANPVVRQTGAYTWHAADLSEEHALRSTITGELSFTAPDGTPINLAYERHVEHPDGNWSWIGRTPGENGESTVITFGEEAAFGTIPQRDGLPLRLTVGAGRAWVVSTDPRLLRDVRNEATDPTGPDYLVPPKLAAANTTAGMEAMGAEAMATTASGKTIVDVLVGFTNGYSDNLSGASAAITRIHNLVQITNQAYVNSKVNAEIRLVHAMQVSYPDATANKTALEELTGFKAPSTKTTPAAAFSGLRSARDQYGADLVVLLRRFQEPENGGCGVAWLIGGGRSGIAPSDEYFGYSVVGDGQDTGTDGKTYFCREETFAHEVGHNMGSQHDSDNAKKDDGSVSYGAYSYSFGYASPATAGNFITVMAYGDSGLIRARVFSNPDVSICGKDKNLPCGIADQADNARSLRATAPAIASFRATVVPVVRARHDINGNGLADMLLYRPSDGRLLPWLSNGAPGFLPGTSILVGGEFRVIATGDFNGDGKMDLIWNRPAGDMQYWHGDGQGFAKRQVFTRFPAGWTLVGTGDIDGDGKTDLVWHRASDGLLAYWIMDGPQITRHGGVSVGGTWRVIAVDDFNGDGKADLLWNRAQGDMQYWEGDGASFAKRQFVAQYPGGWNLLATGDVDGDGKADLLWHRPVDSLLAYWVMSGPVITRHGGASGLSFNQLFAGDFNADGKLDLLVLPTAGSSSYVHWTGDGAGLANRVVLSGYPAGYEMVPWKD